MPGKSGVAPDETIADDDELGNALESVPSSGRILDPTEEDVDYVEEGSPEAAAVEQKPAVPENKEDLRAELAALSAKIDQSAQIGAGFKSFGENLERAIQRPAPQQAPQGPQESEEEMLTRINNQFMENPGKTARELFRAEVRPFMDIMFQNQTVLSKDLALIDPEYKKVYDKYGPEVEQAVANMTPVEKAQNPRIYHAAIQKVRAAHSMELVDEEIERRVQERLAELGAKGGKPAARPAVTTLAGDQRTAQAAPERKTIVIPRWVVTEADNMGISPKVYYQHLKEQGKVR